MELRPLKMQTDQNQMFSICFSYQTHANNSSCVLSVSQLLNCQLWRDAARTGCAHSLAARGSLCAMSSILPRDKWGVKPGREDPLISLIRWLWAASSFLVSHKMT